MASHLPLRDTTPPATTMAIHIAAFPSPALTGDVVSPILVTTASLLMVIGLPMEATAPSSLANAPSARPVFKPLPIAVHDVAAVFHLSCRPRSSSWSCCSRIQARFALSALAGSFTSCPRSVPFFTILYTMVAPSPSKDSSLFSTFSSHIPRFVFLCPC